MFTESTVCVLGDKSPVGVDEVRACAELVRDVARWNRNRTWTRTLACVTDDRDVAYEHLSARHRADADRDPSTWLAYGTAWGNAHGWVIWIKPDDATRYVDTLAHELAHVATRGAHGFTWRRMHVMTGGLIVRIAVPGWYHAPTDIIARRVVSQYRGRRVASSAVDEIFGHVRAAERCRVKFADRVP